MRIIDLCLKDLAQMLRDRRTLLFLVAMPLVFTLFMGFAYGSASAGRAPADQRLALAVVNPEPAGRLNQMLAARLDSSSTVRPIYLTEAEAMDAFQAGEAAGVLIIPVGFSQEAEQGSLAQLTLIAEAASTEGQSLYQFLRGPVSQLMGTVEVARLSAELMGDTAEFGPALALAWSKWDANALRSNVRVEQAVAQASADWTGGNPYNQASPGILVQFAIFGLITSAQILVQERKSRTLQRLMTTAMHPGEIVAGHLLAMFTITFIQMSILVIFGQLALKVNYLREPLGTLVVCVALGLWVAALGLLIGLLAKHEQQVILFALIAMFLFSALGGTWFPLETAGGAFAAIGRWLPSAWAMTGLQNLLVRQLAFSSVLVPAAMLLLYAAGFFGLAVWRFRPE